jgi:MoaA/NifB/PqqE/SkfB family radical SAM enzyme
MQVRGQIIGEPPSRRDFWKITRDSNNNPVIYMVNKRSLWTINAETTVKKQIKETITGEVELSLTAILKREKKPGEVIDAMIDILKNSCLDKEAVIKSVNYQVAYVDDDQLPEILFILKQQ